MLVDAETGKVTAAKPLPLYLKVVVLSGPLHFGNYGGLALKLLWVTSAFGALFITGNGAWLWWARRWKRSHKIPTVRAWQEPIGPAQLTREEAGLLANLRANATLAAMRLQPVNAPYLTTDELKLLSWLAIAQRDSMELPPGR